MNISGGFLFFFVDFLDCIYIFDMWGYCFFIGFCYRLDRVSFGLYLIDGSYCYRCSVFGGCVFV